MYRRKTGNVHGLCMKFRLLDQLCQLLQVTHLHGVCNGLTWNLTLILNLKVITLLLKCPPTPPPQIVLLMLLL